MDYHRPRERTRGARLSAADNERLDAILAARGITFGEFTRQAIGEAEQHAQFSRMPRLTKADLQPLRDMAAVWLNGHRGPGSGAVLPEVRRQWQGFYLWCRGKADGVERAGKPLRRPKGAAKKG